MENTEKFTSNVKSIVAYNYKGQIIRPTIMTGVNIASVDDKVTETEAGLKIFHLSVAVQNAREQLVFAFGDDAKKVAPAETDFIRLTAFGSSAEHFFAKNLSAAKGASDRVTVLAVPSRIAEYTDKDGKVQHSFEMVLVDLIKHRTSSYISAMSVYNKKGERQNLVLLRGHLTKDLAPIKQAGKDHKVISFNIALNGKYARQMNRASNSNVFVDVENQAKFVRVDVWDAYAETFAQRNYTKGSEVQVLGIVSGFYNDKSQLLEVNGYSVSKIAVAKKEADDTSDNILTVDLSDLPF